MSLTALVFTLQAPMASFGDLAVGEIRPSADRPARSALLGLLGAALGLTRQDDAGHQALSEGYDLGTLNLRRGGVLSDFHTAQAPPRKRRGRFATRADELRVPDLRTVLSRRDYHLDQTWRILIAMRGTAQWPLQVLHDALRTPAFALYLGRRSCPLTRPPDPQILEGADLGAVLSGYCDREQTDRERTRDDDGAWLAIDEGLIPHLGAAFSQQRRVTRRDQPWSRTRWQFTERMETLAWWSPPKPPSEESASCI